MERKDFIKKFAFGGSILLTAPMLFNSCADDTEEPEDNTPNPNEIVIDLTDAKYSDLGTVGGWVHEGALVIFRTGDNSYMALAKQCTHSTCGQVTYNHSGSELVCPCHGSKFSTSGAVTNGPASAALKSYTVKKEGDTLKII